MPLETPLVLLVLVIGLILGHAFVPAMRPIAWKIAAGLAVVMFAVQFYLALYWAPPEREMGDVYRIIYMHVPQVWMAFLAFTLNFACSVAFMFKKSWVTDSLAEASAEVGCYFATVGVILGSIWAKPTWGVYWDWDPRLITVTIMIVIYMGYLSMRRFEENPDRRAVWSGVIGILAFVMLPLTWYSVQWWNSLHQRQSSPKTVDPQMTMVLRWSATAFLCLLFVFIVHRYRVAQAQREREFTPPEAAAS